jgi:nondiscriminating glutamyl-tRNA synthetase
MNTPVRVRIAPSPTGNLHIGTARTALFNYLFAHHHGGKMILRIEDTDTQRSQAAYTENLLAGLQGLGLNWDEGPGVEGPYAPYFQSERGELYRQALETLIAKGAVYPCFCTEAELQAERQAAETAGVTYVYSGKWRDADPVEVQQRLAAGESHVWRLKVPYKEVVINDLIRGEIRIHTQVIGDFIIAKGDKSSLYNFAVVVDDIHMQITHVLRGEDHISNTPKQILIYEAFEAPLPEFGHMAMILAPDRSKLSKRHGATSLAAYLQMGYLPAALINYLALLGWSPPEGQEKLSLTEMIQLFDIHKVNTSGAVFDVEKLRWLNSTYVRELSPEQLLEALEPYFVAMDRIASGYERDWLLQVVALVQEKLTLLTDFFKEADFLLDDELAYHPELVDKAFAMASAEDVLTRFRAHATTADWTPEGVHQILETLKSEVSYKMKEIMWPLRAALTGRVAGADLHRSIWLLGREKVCNRVDQALLHLKG